MNQIHQWIFFIHRRFGGFPGLWKVQVLFVLWVFLWMIRKDFTTDGDFSFSCCDDLDVVFRSGFYLRGKGGASDVHLVIPLYSKRFRADSTVKDVLFSNRNRSIGVNRYHRRGMLGAAHVFFY